MKKYYAAMMFGWLCVIISFAYMDDQVRKEAAAANEYEIIEPITAQAYQPEPKVIFESPKPIEPEVVERTIETPLTDEEIDMIARLTYAEAGNQGEEGIRLVIDTILNRVDHPRFPSRVSDVIWQRYQFSPMWNGGYNAAIIRDDIRALVCEELYGRVNYDVIFFTAGGYGMYGKPLFQVGNHYFCSYE